MSATPHAASRIEAPVPLVDLKAQFRSIKEEVNAAIGCVLEKGDFILGSELESFEKEFAAFCGTSDAVGCASGTDALYLALRALDVGPGDEVIVPAMTFIATALAVSQTGARPVLVDVRSDNALLDAERVEAAITERTKVLLPVHLYGQCMDLEPLLNLAKRHGLQVVEDAAQAHGALDSKGRRAGSIGALGCFSFYPGKNLGAYGDGGMVVTSDPGLAEKLRLLRNWGSVKKYHHDVVGYNSRLDTIQAAILRVKLKYLDEWNRSRQFIAKAYSDALQSHAGVRLTMYEEGSIYHLYVIRVAERDQTLSLLQGAGIGAGIHYPFAIHELGAYAHLGYARGAFPVSEDWARHCLSLPIYAELPEGVPARTAQILA